MNTAFSSQSVPPGDLVVTPEMRTILRQSGYLKSAKGGQRLRELYQTNSGGFNSGMLSTFGQACYWGWFDEVRKAVEWGTCPTLSGTETSYEFGYATLVIAGAQRSVTSPPGSRFWAETLKYLLQRGVPVDVPDIVGQTALHHATMNHVSNIPLARILLEQGHANINHRNRYGETAIHLTLMTKQVKSIDLLMELGADLDVADADDITPRRFQHQCGPEVTSAVQRWVRKRNGEQALWEEKCDACDVKPPAGTKLKMCAKCRAARYCSVECQRNHWPMHKKGCVPLSTTNTVILRPATRDFGHIISTSEMVRGVLGIAHHQPSRHSANKTSANGPALSCSRPTVIKVQIPYDDAQDGHREALLIYNKKRDLACYVERQDAPVAYDRIVKVVRDKGLNGMKAYFVAELKNKRELEVKVDEILAEQPF